MLVIALPQQRSRVVDEEHLHLEEHRVLAGVAQDALLGLEVAVGQVHLSQGREPGDPVQWDRV